MRTQGVLWTALGFVVAVLLTLSSAARWWRICAAVCWFVGISTLIAACNGLCLILHTNHQRAVRPWEDPAALYSTFTGGEADEVDAEGHADGLGHAGKVVHWVQSSRLSDLGMEKGFENQTERSVKSAGEKGSFQPSLDAFGDSNESYMAAAAEGDGWVAQYKRKNVPKKVFERTVMVRDSGIRIMQVS